MTDPLASTSDTLSLTARPLTAAAFAPYGQVFAPGAPAVVNDGLAVRRDTHLDLPVSDPQARLCLSVFEVDVRPAPILVRALECHPYSAQVFLPLSPCRALIVVAGTLADGNMDMASLAAFIAAPDQGLCYAPGVWHLGLTSLDRPGRFQMATWVGPLRDTEVRDLPGAVRIDLPVLA
ncbi:ureidoglycolate lyase [Aquabacter cavernae]|uniref:ureidoglycolate lyase n=1 Tax=Aquabacter cavernae TaxID=2496029 RepID=UPI000F8C529B|nr:ureidoglycolate lyase [Aquabacter cavernae]